MGEENSNSASLRGPKSASNTSRQEKAAGTAGRDGCSGSGRFQEGDGNGRGLADYVREADLRK